MLLRQTPRIVAFGRAALPSAAARSLFQQPPLARFLSTAASSFPPPKAMSTGGGAGGGSGGTPSSTSDMAGGIAGDLPWTSDDGVASASSIMTPMTTTMDLPSTSLVDTATTAVMQLGDLKAAGLCNWSPPGLAERLLEAIHVTTGLPWWATVMATTLTVRLLVSPVNIKVARSAARIATIRPRLLELNDQMEVAKQVGDKPEQDRILRQIAHLYQDAGTSPATAFLMPMVTAPVFISFFLALRDIGGLPLEALQHGGALWFTDLTAIDPYYALPVMAVGTTLYTVEKGRESAHQPSPGMKMFFRAMCAGALPFIVQFPAILPLYWFTNSLFGVAFASALRQRPIRRWLDIPDMPTSQSADGDGDVGGGAGSGGNTAINTNTTRQQQLRTAIAMQKKKKKHEEAEQQELGFMEGLRMGMAASKQVNAHGKPLTALEVLEDIRKQRQQKVLLLKQQQQQQQEPSAPHKEQEQQEQQEQHPLSNEPVDFPSRDDQQKKKRASL